jgi:hypothetical protein
MKFALTSGTSTMDKGIETYVFGWNPGAVNLYGQMILAEREYAAKAWLCSLYTYPDKPSPEHLISATVERGFQDFDGFEPDMYTVTLKIRRGHLTLAAFMKKHTHDRVAAIVIDEQMGPASERSILVHCAECGVGQRVAHEALPREPRRWLDRS